MNFKRGTLLLALSVSAFAQTPVIHSGSAVYIEPMDGYETYLAAAFAKKHTPLIVVMDKAKADFIITSTVAHKDLSGGQPAVVVNNTTNIGNDSPGNAMQNAMQQGYAAGQAKMRAFGETDASIAVVDAKSSQVVFADSTYQRGAADQKTRTAERCAKHLKEFIEKPEKQKK